jgi:mono/diheme cytochrome c family protein
MNLKSIAFRPCAGAALLLLAMDAPAAGAESVDFFEKSIRPLLAEHCYECHSAARGKTKGDLALDSRAGWQRGGAGGPVIVPGDVEASTLIHAVRRGDEDTAMPPKKALPPEAVAALEQWVKLGAPDSRDGTPLSPALAAAGSLWSLQPVKNVPVPKPASDWPRTDVDAFLLAALDEHHLAPSPDAAPETLARRLWLVLTGLPPTVREVMAFKRALLEGDPEIVLARTVDGLLASPRFAEKWARHWLDVARYAESNGKALNNGLPYAWRYRDWVIAAIHADKPVDRFLTEQIAGDLLPASAQPERDALNIATGFLAIGSKEQFGGCGSRSIAEVQPEWVDDQINVLGRGILGINIACSRCHDHKFDPVPMEDYYALAGIFFSTDIQSGIKGGKAPEFGVKRILDPDAIPLGDPAALEKLRPVAARLAELEKQITPLEKQLAQAGGAQREKLLAQLNPLKAQADKLRAGIPDIEWAFGLRESASIRNTTLRQRGLWNQHGPEVPRGFLSAVSFDGAPRIPEDHSGRLELAQWLTHPDHPLTARVFVNRVWHHVFGRGLVPTTDNFGMNGEPPSHPELLDFLARRFVRDQAWSLKQLVRDLVLSRAFRQSSGAVSGPALSADPSNRLLGRMIPRRLDAEQIRDGILFSSGQLDLNPRQGTAPMLMEKRFGGLNQKDLAQLRESESQVRHRAIYLAIVRNETLDDTLAAFDFPNNDEPATLREAATVPAQALLLMNQPLVLESSRHLAREILRLTQNDEGRVRQAFIRVLSREPTAEESREALAFLQASPDSLALLCQGLFQSAEFRLLP